MYIESYPLYKKKKVLSLKCQTNKQLNLIRFDSPKAKNVIKSNKE